MESLRNDKKHLRDKEEQLRKKEEQLRDEKKQLREENIILMKARTAAGHYCIYYFMWP